MKEIFLSILRNQSTSREEYRQAVGQLGLIMAAESGQFLAKTKHPVETPAGSAEGTYLVQEPVLVPIIRSGLALLPPFVQMYPEALIGFIGIRRDEKTAAPHLYYSNIPRLHRGQLVFLLDPMIATGGSSVLAVKILKESGIEESQIVLSAILAAPEGVVHLKSCCPGVRTQIVHLDQKLDSKKWIVPGLGDFGDRYFST